VPQKGAHFSLGAGMADAADICRKHKNRSTHLSADALTHLEGANLMREAWFETSTEQDVVQSLQHFVLCTKAAQNNLSAWKWAIIAFHNALQGALVCHLSGTIQLGALEAKCAQKQLKFVQHDRPPAMQEPWLKLATIGALFQRATTSTEFDSKGKPIDWVNDARRPSIAVDEATDWAFKKLVSLRNDSAHFTPKGWSIEVGGLPTIFACLAQFIDKVVIDGWAFRHLSPDERTDLTILLELTRVDFSSKWRKYCATLPLANSQIIHSDSIG
jgi:hypothetical protein